MRLDMRILKQAHLSLPFHGVSSEAGMALAIQKVNPMENAISQSFRNGTGNCLQPAKRMPLEVN